MKKEDVELFGRKTFFIAPDTSLIPKAYLEEFLQHGYETYIINDDYTCSIQKKVEIINRLYPEAIFYFNIDSTIDGIEWKSYVKKLHDDFGDEGLIGIFYSSRENAADEERIKDYYIRELQIGAGCFALSAHNHNNFDSILSTLAACGARGRRNLVRANCDENSIVSFEHNGTKYNARILDVNISHFRCALSTSTNDLSIFMKIPDASLSVNGEPFVSDVTLIMKRDEHSKNLCVFMFIKKNGSPDLDEETQKRINKKIYRIVLDDVMGKLQQSFRTADK